MLKGLLLRNKQDNQYGPRCPEPGTGTPEAPVAVVCVILGMWPMSPLPQESLVLHQCLWLQEPGLPWVISTPLGSQRVWSPPSLLPGSFHCPLTYLPFRLLLDWLAVAFSACTAGSVAETQRDGFKLPGAHFSQKGHLQGSRDTCWPPGFR